MADSTADDDLLTLMLKLIIGYAFRAFLLVSFVSKRRRDLKGSRRLLSDNQFITHPLKGFAEALNKFPNINKR